MNYDETFRLMVDLKIRVFNFGNYVAAVSPVSQNDAYVANDPYAAAHEAILKCAADIAKKELSQ